MFTGIIEEVGVIKNIKKDFKSAELTISTNLIYEDLEVGHSVSTNGVCLTATKVNGKEFIAEVMNETLSRSSLGNLKVGSLVNLERALPVNGRFGGHIVTGHIDGTGRVVSIKKEGIATWYSIKAVPQLMKYIIEKGSIAIDGISLTVATTSSDKFSVSIIPHTSKETIMSDYRVGSVVNLENDIIGKYAERFISSSQGITKDFLIKNGF